MFYLDRRAIKANARTLIREKGAGVMMVSLIYLLLTEGLNTLLNLVLHNPIALIQNQWMQSLRSAMEPYIESGSPEGELNLQPVYAATFSYARKLLFAPRQELLLFVFLLFFLYTVAVSYGYSDWALRRLRGERPGWSAIFDRLEMAGKFILLELLTMLLVGVGLTFFLLPGLYFLYSLRMARYILLDNPQMSVLEAMGRSRLLSRGYKRQIFTLDLSFLGWVILTNVAVNGAYSTGLGIHPVVGTLLAELSYLVFQSFLTPYRELSIAAYYEAMRAPESAALMA